jgi:hypothetical protein
MGRLRSSGEPIFKTVQGRAIMQEASIGRWLPETVNATRLRRAGTTPAESRTTAFMVSRDRFGRRGIGAMRKLIMVVGPALSGGLLADVVWKWVNSRTTTNGVGILARQGWPLNSFWTFVVLGAVAGVIIGRLVEWRMRAYERDLAEVCRRMGLTFLPSAEHLREEHPGLNEMPLFLPWTSGTNRMSGRVADRPVELFDYTVVRRDRNGDRTTRRTVVLLPGAGLPDFDLRPRTLEARMLGVVGVEGISFDPAGAQEPGDAAAVKKFNRLYIVATPDLGTFLTRSLVPPDQIKGADEEQAVRRLFVPSVMRVLTRYPGWSAQAHGGYLALWRGGIAISGPIIGFASGSSGFATELRRPSRFCPARERPKLLKEALALHDGLNRSETSRLAEPIIRAAPGASRAQQGNRLEGAVIGGGIGMLCGILIATVGTFALMFSQAAQKLGGFSTIVAGLIFYGGVLLPIALGAAIGAWLQPTFRRRATRDPSEQRVRLDPNR